MKKIQYLHDLIEKSLHLVFFTGAGISTDSGIPDFRGPSGYWKKNKPINFEDFISSEQVRKIFWKRKFDSEETFTEAKPNKAHIAISKIIKMKKSGHVITQNIDNLHQASGLEDSNLTELHGNTTYAKCLSCQKRYDLNLLRDIYFRKGDVPNCINCGGFIKTATISFGQQMPEKAMIDSYQKTTEADLFLAVGTSLRVFPAAEFPRLAKKNGAKLVIINSEATNFDGLADLVINENISDIFSSEPMTRLYRAP